MEREREQNNALTHSVLGVKNKIPVKLKKQNDVFSLFCSVQLCKEQKLTLCLSSCLQNM